MSGSSVFAYGHFYEPLKVLTASGAYQMGKDHKILVVNQTVGQVIGITLVANPIVGQRVIVKDGKGDANTNNITITPSFGQIDGVNTYVISTAYGYVDLVFNGTQWNQV